MVRNRAAEIAIINGRSRYTEEDWRQARAELHGGHDHSANGNHEMIAWVSESDMVASDTGRQVERLGLEGDGSLGEELVAEGMDEAVHEQMLAAQMRALADGEGDEANEDEEVREEERTTGDEED